MSVSFECAHRASSLVQACHGVFWCEASPLVQDHHQRWDCVLQTVVTRRTTACYKRVALVAGGLLLWFFCCPYDVQLYLSVTHILLRSRLLFVSAAVYGVYRYFVCGGGGGGVGSGLHY